MTEPGKSHLTRRQFGKSALAMGVAAALPGWLRASDHRAPVAPAPFRVTGPDSLRAHAAARGLLYGAAVNPALLDVEAIAAGGTANGYTQLVQAQANILVAENAMKWAGLRPTANTFDFSQADRLLRFAGLAGQRVRGHNLCWHQGLPSWFKTTANKESARQLLTQHIQVVAGRYRGQIHSWDVVNEAVELADGRPDGLRNSPWLELVGPDYIELAFQTAAKADPQAKFTYNEYGIELDTAEQSAKRGQVLLLVRRLKARGVPVHAVGVQSHLQADGPQPGAGLLSFIRECAKLDLEVYVTEMDVNTHSLAGGPEAQDAAVGQVYRSYLGQVLAEPNVPVALTWGLTSANSWLNGTDDPWAKRKDGARQRPLPFDDDLKATPAFLALRAAIDAARPIAPVAAPQPTADPGSLYKPFPVEGSPTAQPAANGPGS
jgi:endo-1,4-beta-xylanase